MLINGENLAYKFCFSVHCLVRTSPDQTDPVRSEVRNFWKLNGLGPLHTSRIRRFWSENSFCTTETVAKVTEVPLNDPAYLECAIHSMDWFLSDKALCPIEPCPMKEPADSKEILSKSELNSWGDISRRCKCHKRVPAWNLVTRAPNLRRRSWGANHLQLCQTPTVGQLNCGRLWA